ncbi:MAG: peptidase T [Lachnospiraceae bacterium]|nr:peptidase T [Lachnospiraceae bacterium]
MRAYERLLDYVKIHTTSDETTGTHPSFAGEFDLARLLEKQLKELGLTNVHVTDKCYVYGFLPATVGYEDRTPIGFIAHMDTAPDASGLNVKPILHENYQGGPIALPSGRVLDPAMFPFMERFKGETVITSDGTTLLGADDKSGDAEIMTALERIITENIPHGPISIGFTPDEEIGEGADFFDVAGFGAKYAYTVDGGDIDEIEYENFNASAATVMVKGLSVHPGSAKDTMINAQNVAMEFHMALPAGERPEHTEDREGFFHLTGMEGSVSQARLSYIVRDHDREKFEARKRLLTEIAGRLNDKYGEGTVSVSQRDQYYNMLEKIEPHMHLIRVAEQAMREAGIEPVSIPVRGGTDGARLSYEGLPCPNLGTGGFNFHGEYECITAERMDRVVDVLVNIVKIYSGMSV